MFSLITELVQIGVNLIIIRQKEITILIPAKKDIRILTGGNLGLVQNENLAKAKLV